MGFLPKFKFLRLQPNSCNQIWFTTTNYYYYKNIFGHNQILFTSIFILFLSHPEYIYTFIYSLFDNQLSNYSLITVKNIGQTYFG